jgi:polyphosphate kinase
VIRLPQGLAGCEYGFIFLSSVLHAFVGELFAGMNVLGCYQFRVTRNSDLFVDEEEVKNLRAKIQGELPQRHFGDAVRLEVADNCSAPMTEFLLSQFNLSESDLYRVSGPVNRKTGQHLRQHQEERHPAASPLPELHPGDRPA